MADYDDEAFAASDGAALTWILDHYLRYPASYEIPLRSMYALNAKPTTQPLSTTTVAGNLYAETAFQPRASTNSSQSSSSAVSDTPSDVAAQFKAQLITQISRLPSQPCSLPPSFITSFLRRCFAVQLEKVDFPQALTGLDYLRDLEKRRRKEVVASLQRLQIDPHDLRQREALANKYPGVLSWITSMETKEKKVEALYTQVYLGLRRWVCLIFCPSTDARLTPEQTLINEILLEPYNRANCYAMLNTLFPPVTEATTPPTSQLTHQILKSQRDGFFRYISAFEKNGARILDRVIKQGARDGEENGWPLVRDALDKYLRIANEIIDECAAVNDPASLEPKDHVDSRDRKGRKADSGISFASSGKYSTITTSSSATRSSSSSSSSAGGNGVVFDKPLPPSPSFRPPKTGSKLERLARELKKLGDAGKSKSLRTMRSTSALGHRSENPPSRPVEGSFFDDDEHKRRRLIWEATNRKKKHVKQSSFQSQ